MEERLFLFDKEWKQIPDFEGYYASRDGEILSLVKSKKKPRILKQIRSEDGHMYVFLYRSTKMTKMFVHRAVLLAWVGKPKTGQVGRHLDDDGSHNVLENLVWGSPKENSDDRRRNKGFRSGEKSPSSKLTKDQILLIREQYADGRSSRDLGCDFGVSHSTILSIVRGESWSNIPTVPLRAKHSPKRKTPLSKEEIKKGTQSLNKYAASVKKERKMVPCACGCGQIIVSVDSKGRDRKFAKGHNQRGRHWRNKDD